MNRIIITKDGSHTVYNDALDEHYHSVNGAIQESRHVFINAGLNKLNKNPLSVLEIGFGTGLNCLLTYIECLKTNIKINYSGIELFPLTIIEVNKLNFAKILGQEAFYNKIHLSVWEKKTLISKNFELLKLKTDIKELKLSDKFDLVYFDAFSPKVQSELWTQNVFEEIFNAMNSGDILTTYSAKGVVRRTLQDCGFMVERIPGPPGKREMLRALKK